MRKYIVVDQKKHGDMFQTVCDTLEAANAEAKYQWGHLTDQEKTERHIFVGHVEDSEECLCYPLPNEFLNRQRFRLHNLHR